MTTPRWLRRTAIAALVVLAFSAFGLQVASAEVTFTEFTAGISGITLGIDVGADSNLWFTEVLAGVVGRITPAGVVTEFDEGVPADFGPGRIAAGPDGNLWFVERDSDRIGSVSTAGVITVYDGPAATPRTSPRARTATCGSPREPPMRSVGSTCPSSHRRHRPPAAPARRPPPHARARVLRSHRGSPADAGYCKSGLRRRGGRGRRCRSTGDAASTSHAPRSGGSARV